MKKSLSLIIILTILFLSSCSQQSQQPIKSDENTVIIKNFAFNPQTITIKTGTTIKWINEDSAPHTVTSQGSFDSSTLSKGDSFSYTFNKAGEFNYICTIHPSMKGKIIVQ